MHGAFVQRCKAYAVELVRERKVDHRLQRIAGQTPRFGRGVAALELRRIDIAEIDERQIVSRKPHFIDALVAGVRQAHTGVPNAEIEHARIADDDEIRTILHHARREDFRGDLGSDACDVAEHESHSR
jgi:hypothetical protein